MNQKKGNITILILLGIVLIAGIASYFWWQSKQTPNSKTPLTWDECAKNPRAKIQLTYPETCTLPDGRSVTRPTKMMNDQQASSSGEIAKWKTYINTEYNYLLKYPSENEGPGMYCGGVLIQFNPAETCNETSFALASYRIVENPLKTSLEDFVTNLTDKSTVESKKQVQISGKLAFQAVFKGWLKDGPYLTKEGLATYGGQLYDNQQKVYYLKISDSQVMKVQYDLEICQEYVNQSLRDIPCKPSENIALAEKILKTLTFFEPNQLNSLISQYWDRYQNDFLGFQLKHPASWKTYSNENKNYIVFNPDPTDLPSENINPNASRYFVDLSILVNNNENNLDKISKTDYQLVNKSVIKFADQNAIRAIFTSKDKGYSDEYPTEILFNKNGKGWTIAYPSYTINGEHNQIFDQILSTFKFL